MIQRLRLIVKGGRIFLKLLFLTGVGKGSRQFCRGEMQQLFGLRRCLQSEVCLVALDCAAGHLLLLLELLRILDKLGLHRL